MPQRYWIVKPPFLLVGLLIVLALLGHDLLMAVAGARAAVPPPRALHRHSPTHDRVEVMAGLSHDSPESPHPSVCGIGGTALLQSVDQLGVSDLSTPAAVTACHFPASTHMRILRWEEPRWPPSIRRALLQVYRI